jgi:hypothetical protein
MPEADFPWYGVVGGIRWNRAICCSAVRAS